jgi:hypothetical protein
MAKFAEVIECLKNGGTAARQAWDVRGDMEVMMQIPQRISKDIVPKMTSVQEHIKPKINTVGSGEIEYHDQVIIITFVDDEKTPARATYYFPTWEDIFADDWRLSEPYDAYKHHMTAESEQLNGEIDDLKQFFRSPLFESLPEENQLLMKRQCEAMGTYYDILQERIKLEFKKDEDQRP